MNYKSVPVSSQPPLILADQRKLLKQDDRLENDNNYFSLYKAMKLIHNNPFLFKKNRLISLRLCFSLCCEPPLCFFRW